MMRDQAGSPPGAAVRTAASSKNEDWMDIRDAARVLAVSEKTIRRRIKAGKIRSQKKSGVWFVAVEQAPKTFRISPPPAAAEVPRSAAEPPEPRTENDPRIGEIKEIMRHVLRRLDEVDKKLYVLAEERERVIAGAHGLTEMESRIARLTEENRRLESELAGARTADARPEYETHAPQPGFNETETLRARADEIRELKATIGSNERGLTLLRGELEKKDEIIRHCEREIARLENEMRPLKSRPA